MTGQNLVTVALGPFGPTFPPVQDFAVGLGPISVAVADFNLDGKLDIVTANLDSDNISVLLGNGAGSFAAAVNFNVGVDPGSVKVGDFNLDGKADLVTANQSSNNLSVLLGNGSGGFAAATNFSAGTSPFSVTVGDLNLDGKPDLAVGNYDSNNVSVLLGNGAGSFGSAANFNVGSNPKSVFVGDFDLDGKPDLAAANFNSSNVSVLLNICDGSSSGCPITSPENKISWWKGEGNPNDTVGSNNGTLVGGTTYTAGKVGQAFNLNGTNSGVTIPHNTNLDVNPGGFSAEFWMKSNGPQGGRSLGHGQIARIYRLGRMGLSVRSVSDGQHQFLHRSRQWRVNQLYRRRFECQSL